MHITVLDELNVTFGNVCSIKKFIVVVSAVRLLKYESGFTINSKKIKTRISSYFKERKGTIFKEI